ncbi:MAG TPA: CAP domain-containing protein [Solirubrobacteraceae bacterium]
MSARGSVLRALRAPAGTRASAAPARCANTGLQPTRSNLAAIDAATFCLIEQIRVAHHLHPLHFNRPLQGVAAGQAHDMVAGDYFGDDSISGLTPMQRILATPYPSHAKRVNSAQNIGWATGPFATPAAMVAAWMNSPPHRAIILTARFRDVGVGVTPAAPSSLAQGLSGATYTLEFGERIFAGRTARKH